MDLILAQHSYEQLVPISVKEQDIDQAFIHEIYLRVSPEHAALFAESRYIKNIIYWHTQGQKVAPLRSLSQNQQQDVIKVVQSILIDIASVARLYPDAQWSRDFAFNSCFPAIDYIYIVDGRPVITGWGYSGVNGFYDPLQANIANIKTRTHHLFWSKFPWITALMALLIGVLCALLWNVIFHSDKVCYASYPLVKESQDIKKEQDRNNNLVKKRDNLLKSINNLKTQCQLPPVKSGSTQNSTELKKPDTVDLPKTSWEKKEVSMLDGCWNLTTPLTLRSQMTKKIVPVKTWQVCFDGSGKGNQTITMVNGITCKGPLFAHFKGEKIILEQPENCIGDFTLVKGSHVCTRTNDREASCLYRDNDQDNSQGSLGIFKR